MSERGTTPELKLRDVILARYRSVRAFCNLYNLPYSTIDNVFKRGVNSVSISTATQICNALELDLSAFGKGIIAGAAHGGKTTADLKETELLGNYRKLDSYGRELVGLVAEKEAVRCENSKVLQPAFGEDGWRQYLGAPIACRGGGVTAANEEEAKQMERIYNGLLAGTGKEADRHE